MPMVRWLVIVAVLALGATDVSAAHSCPATRKLGRGVANLFLGFTEVPRSMMEVGRYHGQVAGATWGMAEGLCKMIARMGVGLLEIVTFPVPFPKEHYAEPILKPEFPGDPY